MTEADTSYTSTLLPGARVMMFANDAQSVEAFKSLSGDWRFTRVRMEHFAGGVDQAIMSFQSGAPAPDLLIIETETIDDSFISRLEDLAAHCPEGTSAIIIGPVNDVSLYRKLIAMGISEYMVRPVRPEILIVDIAKNLIEKIGAAGSRLVAVMGAKGGVGTTVIAQGLAWTSADILKQKTMLMDASGGWSTLSVGMNFEPATTLHEAIRAVASSNKDSFSRMIHHADERLDVLSSGSDIMLEDCNDPAGYEGLLNKLMTTYPVVVVDLSASPSSLIKLITSRANEIVLVTTPVLPALRAARTLIHEIKDIRSDVSNHVDLVVNMSGLATKQEVPRKDLEAALERKPSVEIEFDPAILMALESEGRKITSTPAGDALARRLLPLLNKVLKGTGTDIQDIANDDRDKAGPLSGLLSKLKKS